MICDGIHEDLSSKYDINCTPDMKIRNLTIEFVSRYGNMTNRYQLHQPKPMIESKMVKHIKFFLFLCSKKNVIQINIYYYLKLRIPIMHSQFFRKLSQNRDYIQTHCNDRRNPFHFACRQWYSYNNPQF